MESLKKAIAEDFKVTFEAFKNDSFDRMNIYSNRMMSNAIFGNDPKIFLPGFFLKDVAFTYGVLKARESPTAFSTAKAHGMVFVENLGKLLSSLDEEKLWKEFHDFNDKTRKFDLDDLEEKSYSDNVDFTKMSFSWLLAFLSSNRDLLLDPHNFLLKGIISEMVRIYKVHSGSLSETILIYLIEALDRNYDYICRISGRPDVRFINEEKVKKETLPFIDKIAKVYTPEPKVSEADSILWELVKSWREMFIRYLELPPPGYAFQRGIELPEELKKKLAEGITKALEKKI
jgi:hypothetical protein